MPRFDGSKVDLSNIITISPSSPLTVSDIVVNQVYRIVSDPNTIDDTGRTKINEMIAKVNFRDPEWDSILPAGFDPYDWNDGHKNRLDPLPDDWCWKNTIASKKEAGAEYGVGKFAKRVRAYYLKTQNFAMPDKWIQDLGQIAGRYSDQSTGCVLRFVNKFNWEAGDFGDGGSCFWGGREQARDILADNGALAVQIFTPESVDAGLAVGQGRAWLIKNYPAKGVMTMFNGYGKNMGGDVSRTIARILSNAFGMTKYQDVKLRNHDSADGTLYINSGRGFVIGKTDEDFTKKTWDLHWPEESLGTCCHCGREILEDDDHDSLGDNLYCQSCWDEYISYDDIAGESYDTDFDGNNMMYRRNRFGTTSEYWVSDDTLERYATQCDGCGEYYHTDDIDQVETSEHYYCSDCMLENTSTCDCCSTQHENDELEDREDDNGDVQMLCSVCAADFDEAHEEVEEILFQPTAE